VSARAARFSFPAVQLCKLIPRLASEHDGEIVATARAIGRTLESAGCDFHDLANAIERAGCQRERAARDDQQWIATATWCLEYDRGCLTDRERIFLHSMMRWNREPSERQADWLRSIADKLRRAA
jgi:hypothetical protein